MIRPLTIATFLLACGSGLYLYQSKHEVQLLDRSIERTVQDTNALREQSRLLVVEWRMLNDPERLRHFSDTYLKLKSIEPRQFASLADLNDRLPAPRAEVAPGNTEDPELMPTGAVDGAQPLPDPNEGGGAEEVLPLPPIPAAHPILAAASTPRLGAEPKTRASEVDPSTEINRPLKQKILEPDGANVKLSSPKAPEARAPEARATTPRPPATDSQARSAVIADARVNDQRGAEPRVAQRVADSRSEVRPPLAPPRPILLATPQPVPVIARSYTQPAPTPVPIAAPSRPAVDPIAQPYRGSLLGMARNTMPPAPRPTPLNASYNAN